MGILDYVGTTAALCTTTAFIPQIAKIRRQGAEDLSFPMLFLYLIGVLLWFTYGLLLHAAAVIWANAATSFLVAVALVLKLTEFASNRRIEGKQAQAAGTSQSRETCELLRRK
jgi:MtN3 and saliva related transmembrane protein